MKEAGCACGFVAFTLADGLGISHSRARKSELQQNTNAPLYPFSLITKSLRALPPFSLLTLTLLPIRQRLSDGISDGREDLVGHDLGHPRLLHHLVQQLGLLQGLFNTIEVYVM